MRTFSALPPLVRGLAVALAIAGTSGLAAESMGVNARSARRLFAHPPREYSSAPLWVWNDWLTEESVKASLRDLAGQGVKQAMVHPRPGLMTPYLGEEWFKLWKSALREAQRLDMNLWIYDENSYPSGFAGGWVPELMPESRGMGLVLTESSTAPDPSPAALGLYRLTGEGAVDVTQEWKGGSAPGGGSSYLLARLERAGNSPWHGGRSYVNLLTQGVTAKFLEITLGAYDREIGSEYGRRVPGVFSDEPNIRPAGGFPWCPDLPQQFSQDWGEDLLPNLPALVREVGDWRQIRHHYFSTLNRLFIDRWAQPYFEACDRRGLELTGHYWDHEWPNGLGVPDNMAMAAWQHRPGIDTLMNQYAEQTHAQFGNVRICREISSIANQLDRSRTLVELYGAGGWDLRFEDMKRIAEWLQVLGINTMDEHLSYISLRGARKRDHPQSFSYHEPWWPAYHVHAALLTRLSAALSQGAQINRVLVLEPTTTAWMHQGHEPNLRELGDQFFNLLMALEKAQVEYDLGCEDVIARHGRIGGAPPIRHAWSSAATFSIGKRAYEVVVLPPGTENLEARTWDLLRDFALAGGRILACTEPPGRISGRPRETSGNEASWRRRWERVEPGPAVEWLQNEMAQDDVVVRREANDPGILFHHRRQFEDGQLLFLVNTSRDHPSRGMVLAKFAGVESWDPYSGDIRPYACEETTTGVSVSFELPPCGSQLLFLSQTPPKRKPPVEGPPVDVPSVGAVTTHRVGPNVLTLDYVDVTVADETRAAQYFYAANQWVWQKHGLERSPWDSAVQFKDEWISRQFPPSSGFEATYRFKLDTQVPPDLTLVIERPDLYSITCNGATVRGSGGWWLDKAFGKIPIAAAARPGENTVTLRAKPFTIWHELESAYLLGSFRLESADRGWVVIADGPPQLPVATAGEDPSAPAEAGWNSQGHPFYAEGVVYRQEFAVTDSSGRFQLSLPKWYGSVAKVEVNGKEAGWITAPPWTCDVTRNIRRGRNVAEITVIGTLKNTLGPHHGGHALGSAWPAMFQQGANPGPPAGDRYATVAYGLFRPALLQQVRER